MKLRNGFLVFLVAAGSVGLAEPSQFPEPDHDGDTVSDYDDYCPSTPRGSSVWRYSDFQSGRAQLTWVGCAGGQDSNRGGYRPPLRPANPTMYDQVDALVTRATTPVLIPPGHDKAIHVGRCYKVERPNQALLFALQFKRGRIIDGPLGPETFYVQGYLDQSVAADSFDILSGAEIESKILEEDIAAELLGLNSQGIYYIVGKKANRGIVFGEAGGYLVSSGEWGIRCYTFITKTP